MTARAEEAVNKTTAKKQSFILSSIQAPFNSNDLVIQVVSKLELTARSDIFDNFSSSPTHWVLSEKSWWVIISGNNFFAQQHQIAQNNVIKLKLFNRTSRTGAAKKIMVRAEG